jgi:Thiol-disulfide isomerase and thioredoxins
MGKFITTLLAVALSSTLLWATKPIKKEELQKILSVKNDTTYVVNFWATWCAPCIKELPHFVKLQDEYKDRAVKVILVSLDFESQLQKRVIPFLKQRNIELSTFLLAENNPNSFIDSVDPSWSGAIPATVIFNKNKRMFYEQDFSYAELEDALKPFLSTHN